MVRRASSTVSPAWLPGVLALIVLSLVGGYLLVHRVRDPYRTVPALDVAAYLDNANSLRGHTYKVAGTIGHALAWSPVRGRLFSIEVAGAAGPDVLPVLVPAEFNHVNIQRGQRFQFRIEVDELGLLLARDLSKT